VGQLKHDGRATQNGMTAPGAEAITFGDLYRLNLWNGIALKTIGASDTVRTLDLEIAPDRVWYVKVPAAINPAVGAYLYWSAGTGFKRGDTHLQTTVGTAGDAPCAKVEEVKDPNGYVAVRVLNVGNAA
jgi:hypothetical protein